MNGRRRDVHDRLARCATQATPLDGSDKTVNSRKTKFTARHYRKAFKKWSTNWRETLNEILDRIVASPVLNTGGEIKLERDSETGAPKIFRSCLRDEYDLYDWWSALCLEHYWTMDDLCDLENDTKESPTTIFLLFVIVYYKSGGFIDEFLRSTKFHGRGIP